MAQDRMRVVVVGAGFAGLEVARRLGRAPVEVTVVDRYNHHLFQPLLYQVATSVLSPGDISAPIRSVVRRNPNTLVLLAEARSVDTGRKVLVCDHGEVPYDVLVLATGATHSYFAHPEWARQAPGLKTVEDAIEIRRRLLRAFEAAEREPDPALRQRWMTFVIIGGGPTGVELAGAMSDLAFHTLRNEFRRIDTTRSTLILLEGQPRILSAFPKSLSEYARRELERRGVQVRTGALVDRVDDEGVQAGGWSVRARTVLWGAGVAASPLVRSLGAPLDRAGRLQVTPELTVPGHDDVFVIGDVAAVIQDGQPVPGVAPAAKQMGIHVASAIGRRAAGRPLVPFRYRDRGSFAVIGRGAAVGLMFGGKVKLKGWLGFLAWSLIHVAFLVGFRNRFAVMFEWFWYLLTRRQDIRIITGTLEANFPRAEGVSDEASRQPQR